jgi:hypothetical protein
MMGQGVGSAVRRVQITSKSGISGAESFETAIPSASITNQM